MQIIIPGDPIPKARHRSCIIAGKICNYDKQGQEKKRTSEFLRKTLNAIDDATEGNDLYPEYFEAKQDLQEIRNADYFYVDMIFFLKLPKSSSKKNQKMMLEGKLKHGCKPDISNLIKYYEDCANGIIWPDDKQIVKISAEKRYAAVPFTLLNVFGIQKNG